MSILYAFTPSPIGQLLLAGTGAELQALRFPPVAAPGDRATPDPHWLPDPDAFEQAKAQLAEYFAGARQTFNLRLAPRVTAFQAEVLAALGRIPYGETRSYSAIARSIGRPTAVRAVGAANARNPLPILIPCHRVVGADGSLTGFGGGLPAKRHLLNLEQRTAC